MQSILHSGESRILFFPERSSICQYPCKISAINVKKQSRARLDPPCIVHFKNTKNIRCILKTTISKSSKKRQAIGYVRQLAVGIIVARPARPHGRDRSRRQRGHGAYCGQQRPAVGRWQRH